MREIECNQYVMVYTVVKQDRNCDHHNVVKYYGYCMQPLSLVMELIHGLDMFHFIHSRSLYSWGNVHDFLLYMSAGLAHVHSKGILHRDLKSTNFLVRMCAGASGWLMQADG